MESTNAVAALSALAHEGRLLVFRTLVRAGPKGLAAGRISEATKTPPNTLTAQLNLLAQAGLVTSERHGRSIVYSACFERASDLIVFLMEDCCGGEACVASDVEAAASRLLCCSPESEATDGRV